MITHLNEMAIQRIYNNYDWVNNISEQDANSMLNISLTKTPPDFPTIKTLITNFPQLAENFNLTTLFNSEKNNKYIIKLLKLFIPNGADVNKKNERGQTALFKAMGSSYDGSEKTVEYLLQNNADATITDIYNNTPVLHMLSLRILYVNIAFTEMMARLKLVLDYTGDICKNAKRSPTVVYLSELGKHGIYSFFKERCKKLFLFLKENDPMFLKYDVNAIVNTANALPVDAYFAYQELNS